YARHTTSFISGDNRLGARCELEPLGYIYPIWIFNVISSRNFSYRSLDFGMCRTIIRIVGMFTFQHIASDAPQSVPLLYRVQYGAVVVDLDFALAPKLRTHCRCRSGHVRWLRRFRDRCGFGQLITIYRYATIAGSKWIVGRKVYEFS